MKKKIASQFKKPSGFLGKIISFVMIKGNGSNIKSLIKNLNIKPNDKILEIGYGPGLGVQHIAKNFSSCQIVGIDFSELMHKKASKRNKQYIEQNRVDLLFGDFIDTEINTKDFDKIYCLNVVYFWDNLQKPFEKIKSLLKKEGIFSFYMASVDDLNKIKFTIGEIFNKYTIEQALESLKLAGFEQIDYYYDKGYFIQARA